MEAEKPKPLADYSLCYVEGGWAYFTEIPLATQWGDDWNDAPHYCNAGLPYTHHWIDGENGQRVMVDHRVITVGYDGLDQVGVHGKEYSVEDFNARLAPWLETSRWDTTHGYSKDIRIYGGVTLREFDRLVREAGGSTYYSMAVYNALIAEGVWHNA